MKQKTAKLYGSQIKHLQAELKGLGLKPDVYPYSLTERSKEKESIQSF